MPFRPQPLIDLDPANAVGPPAGVETHISIVLFAGSRAMKLCKPVDFGFVDYSTASARRAAMRRELEVNRRFAPDVYLGTIDLTDDAGAVVDTALVMRWLPADRRLSLLLADPDRAEPVLREVARQVAAIHAGAPRSAEIDAVGAPEVQRTNWLANLDVLERFGPPAVAADDVTRARALVEEYVAGRIRLFERRIAEGHIVDGHGDLLTDDIFCLDDGPRILDALAFSDSLRFGDVLLDAAFLAMDIERRATASLADRFLGWYDEFSGEHHPASLAHFYIAYRASVRAKVACLRAEQGDDAARAHVARDLAQCLRHLDQARVQVVVVGGPPGVGKTTLAEQVAGRMGWAMLSTDDIRRETGGPHPGDAFGTGRYAPSQVGDVYAEMLRRAAILVERGDSVVLDASWSDSMRREAVRRVASEHHAGIVEVCCEVDPAIADDRIRARAQAGGSTSDATPDIARALRARFAPWPQAVVVDTAPGADAAGKVALSLLHTAR